MSWWERKITVLPLVIMPSLSLQSKATAPSSDLCENWSDKELLPHHDHERFITGLCLSSSLLPFTVGSQWPQKQYLIFKATAYSRSLCLLCSNNRDAQAACFQSQSWNQVNVLRFALLLLPCRMSEPHLRAEEQEKNTRHVGSAPNQRNSHKFAATVSTVALFEEDDAV